MKAYVAILIFLLTGKLLFAQEVPILNYSINNNGQVQLEVNSSPDKYYVLQVRQHPDSAFDYTTSVTLGQEQTTIISEPLKALPLNYYRVLEYEIDNPNDTDNDGLNDLEEIAALPNLSPLNAAVTLPSEHALLALNTVSSFEHVSTQVNVTPWVGYLTETEYAKFIIIDFYTTNPKIYFINTNTHPLHSSFTDYLEIEYQNPDNLKGQIIYHPNVLANNGTEGTFTFNFSSPEPQDFYAIQRTHELLASNMLFLENNFSYFIAGNNEQFYQNNIAQFENSRIPVVFETDVYAGINYWGLNQTEGYGYFRMIEPSEVPNSRDIVLYDFIPNALPRVGGIISSFVQTPLSHVNLRAIDDNIPNAFIRNPLNIDSIADLLNHYIYFKANQSSYEIREATLQEVNAWYENRRPANEQTPPLNLSYTTILTLDAITFEMSDGFGAKTSNLATMRTFDFQEGTIPDGFGIPFYFYQEFMRHNGLFDVVGNMIQQPDFIADRNVRDERLAELRTQIKTSSMPDWMMEQLAQMQNSFPQGTSIRCRSSTNNEDLPEFSGAGLYDSKTHHPDEGHIAKTIKQVFASLWNLRAFEEREFYRVNHFATSMGVLCHPNFEDEKVNGVGVSADPVFDTNDRFYINSQFGEELITNPTDALPEELLLERNPDASEMYFVIQYSSSSQAQTLLMTDEQITLLRDCLAVIHDKFAVLYDAEDNPTFAMDIEFKIDSTNQLSIKQARPWVTYVPSEPSPPIVEYCSFGLYPNPATEAIRVRCENCGITTIRIINSNGKVVMEKTINETTSADNLVSIEHLSKGLYIVSGSIGSTLCKSVKFIKY